MNILFIQHHAPYDGYYAQEMLDMLLVVAAFGQTLSVLFQGDGVWQLVAKQQPQTLGRLSIVAQLQALPLYDVEAVYVDEQSLRERGLTAEQLLLPVQIIHNDHIASFINQHQQLIRF